ncbi:phosphoglycerate kinase [Patescibacteria group bacterium]|nr:phosphoglycerate kinase [Patescibacteria group bacterium]MBU1967267.1 phosphoglycerate kinase [Patescibacteria group bacterium]
MKLRLPTNLDVKNKTVLVRVDYNVPLKKVKNSWRVENDRRILASFETIKFLQKNHTKIILMTHLGRPKGKFEAGLSSEPVARYLTKNLNIKTSFVDDCIGEKVQTAIDQLPAGGILLLENLRFHPEEKKNDKKFARQLANLADVYINEAFSSSHRAHASTEGVTHYLPSFAGFNLQKEVLTLHKLMTQPDHPFFIIVGGAKISDKIDVLENLLQIADGVLVGGVVANNFLKAEGVEIHKSYLQDTPADLKKEGVNFVKLADELIEETKTEKILKDGYIPLPKILYPIDVIAAASPDSTQTQVIDLIHDMKDSTHDKNLMYLDIGPKTIKLYQELINQARTIFWNGPMGYFEKTPFRTGTVKIAQALAKANARTVAGGGDTVDLIADLKLEKDFTYISTAGGASLLFLAGQKLPALNPLTIGTRKHYS